MQTVNIILNFIFSVWLVFMPSLTVEGNDMEIMDSCCSEMKVSHVDNLHESSCEDIILEHTSDQSSDMPCETDSDCKSCCICIFSFRSISFIYESPQSFIINEEFLSDKIQNFKVVSQLFSTHYASIWHPPKLG